MDEFVNGFCGLTADYSTAQMNGFKDAVKEFFCLSDDEAGSIKWEDLLRFCYIHYTRSVHKVAKNSDLIPGNKKDMFIELALRLASRSISRSDFDSTVETIIKDFPSVSPWVRWYQQANKAKIAFPAMNESSTRRSDDIIDNTNAQESLNRIFNLVTVNKPKTI